MTITEKNKKDVIEAIFLYRFSIENS